MPESVSDDGSSGANNKPRLTEHEKRANHIASENKRRNAIREQFDRIASMVPGMEGQGKSEGRCLEAMVKYAKDQLRERERLIGEIERRGGNVREEDKEVLKAVPNQ
jgi:heteromeric Ino2p/Ino4p transcription factor